MFDRVWAKFHSIVRLSFGLLCLSLIAISFENCSEVAYDLNYLEPAGTSFNSFSEFDLQTPLKTRKIDRYIFLVDMSFSMISGPCPQDVDANIIFNRNESRQTVNGWDPNKLLPNRSITDYQQSTAFDCYVDLEAGQDQFPLPFRAASYGSVPPIQNSTIVGSDYKAYRLSVVKKWIQQLRTNLSPERQDAAKVLIVPFTTGVAMDRLLREIRFQFRFHDLNEVGVDDLLDDLTQVHETQLEKATDENDFHRWKDRSMGASSPAAVIEKIYNLVYEDMNALAQLGVLRRSSYDFFILSDGILTPIKEQIDLAVSTHFRCHQCSQEGGACPNLCKNIREGLEKIVGQSDSNSRLNLALKFNRIQGLTQFFGSGKIRNHFVQVNQEYVEKVYQGQLNLFELLGEEYEKFNYGFKYWKLDKDNLPFDLATNQIEYQNFSLTGVIILNPNLRVGEDGILHYDSDADGLFDEEEEKFGTDPLNPRTWGVCLDSMAINPAYKKRCEALATLPDCGVHLDTDMDSLNECEERLLGSDRYDFDTDDDLIPDYYEWIYQFNPIASDRNIDTNGDGITNLNAFLAGLGPAHNFINVDDSMKVLFELSEEVTDQRHEDVWISQFSINLTSIPYGPEMIRGSIPHSQSCLLYHTRSSDNSNPCDSNGIAADDLLFHVNQYGHFNRGVALLRLRDRDKEDNIIWKIMKFDISFADEKINVFDLKNFRDFDVIDEVSE